MKFLMKVALDNIIPSGTTPRFPSSGSTPVNMVLSNCLRGVENLCNYLFPSHLPGSLKKILNNLAKKIIEVNHVPTGKALDIDLMPLIKATTYIENCDANYDLTGRSILCVGGRAKLYPVYRHLVETSGGSLMTFYGNSNDNIDQLYELLEYADMVICPVDCVNHEAYFTVKRYCKCSGKLCALLERSQVAVFQKGIETLTAMAAKQTKL